MQTSYSFNAERPLEKYRKSDFGFLIAVILLWGVGIFTLFVCSQAEGYRKFEDSYYFVKRQLICSAVGFAGFLFFGLASMKVIRKILPYFAIFTVILCILCFIPGVAAEKLDGGKINGARRWIKMPFNFTFQPSELAKFAIVLFLANFFDKQKDIENPEEKSVLQGVIGLTLVTLIVYFQKDLSTSAFIFCIGILMFLATGTKLSWFGLASPLIMALIILSIVTSQYRLERILGYIHPTTETQSLNFQANNAVRAISSGGLLGTGIGMDMVKFRSVPEVKNDYIFAGWVEAFGFIGVLAYMGLLFFFAWKGFKICKNTGNRFAAYASFGCVLSIVVQSLLNIAVVCHLIPSTGIPLPFFSMGGSSIIVTLMMCGFVLNASRCDEPSDNIFEIVREKNIKTEYMNVELGDI
ncbi:MAG: cell division protein FtsW [Treponema sp.]|nr:cell division protein FtsW [Treponema sp.]